MIVEIESTEIIAYSILRQIEEDYLELSYSDIWERAALLEENIPSVRSECDMISIDAFRCRFPMHVNMNEHALEVRNIKEIESDIRRLLPNTEIIELLDFTL